MLHVGRLKVLTEVVGRGSFSAAAEALSYTQSAVSQAIARLEAETGTTLVVRDRQGIRPTAAGATLVEHAEAIFAQIDAAETDLAAVLGVRVGRLRMASFPSAGATLMPLAVATFREAHPDVALTLAEGEPEEIAPRLRAGEFDLALLFEFPGVRERPGAGLRTRHAARGPDARRAAGRAPARRQARADARRPARRGLGADVGVEPVRAARRAARAWRPGSSPDVTFESDDYETVQGLVAAGVGVALIPRLALTRVHPGIVVRELAPRSPERKVVAATTTGPGVAPAARTMIRVLSDVARRYTDAHLSVLSSAASAS